jgi:hypothetical protein
MGLVGVGTHTHNVCYMTDQFQKIIQTAVDHRVVA